MIVKANKTLKHKELHKKGEVFQVSDVDGRQLVKAGLVEEVSQRPQDRKTKPQSSDYTIKKLRGMDLDSKPDSFWAGDNRKTIEEIKNG